MRDPRSVAPPERARVEALDHVVELVAQRDDVPLVARASQKAAQDAEQMQRDMEIGARRTPDLIERRLDVGRNAGALHEIHVLPTTVCTGERSDPREQLIDHTAQVIERLLCGSQVVDDGDEPCTATSTI